MEGAPEIVRLNDYNALMSLYGKNSIEMGNDEFVIICNYAENKTILNYQAATNEEREETERICRAEREEVERMLPYTYEKNT